MIPRPPTTTPRRMTPVDLGGHTFFTRDSPALSPDASESTAPTPNPMHGALLPTRRAESGP